MKKELLLMALMLGMAVSASAQQVRFGIEGGMNLSGIKTNDDKESNPKGLSAGWQIGGTASYEFKNHITLMSGLTLMHTQRNGKFSPSYGGYFPKAEVKSNQLTLPIKAGYDFHVGKALSITPFVGLYASYHFSGGSGNMDYYNHAYYYGEEPVKARWKAMNSFSYQTYIYDENGEITNTSIEEFAPLRRWTWGAVGGVNATINDHYTISLQYMEDFKRIHKDLNFRDYSLMLSVGYKF